jgi:hypothetical protein
LNNVIDNYIKKKFPENDNISEGDYKKFMNVFDIKQILIIMILMISKEKKFE